MKAIMKLSRLLALCFVPGILSGQCLNQGFNDFEVGTAGSVPTSSTLALSEHGISPGTWSTPYKVGPITYTSVNMPLIAATGVLCTTNASYPAGQGSLGIVQTGDGVAEAVGVQYTLTTGTLNSLSTSVWFCADSGSNSQPSNSIDVFMIRSTSSDYANIMFIGGTRLQGEAAGGVSSAAVTYNPGTGCGSHGSGSGWVELQIQFNHSAPHQVAVYDVNGNQIGSTMSMPSLGGGSYPNAVLIGHAGSNQVLNAGSSPAHLYWDSLQFSTDGTFPIVGQSTGILSPCDVNQDGVVNGADIQLEISQALGQSSCTADLDKNGVCNVVDVQRVVNASLGGQCLAQ